MREWLNTLTISKGFLCGKLSKIMTNCYTVIRMMTIPIIIIRNGKLFIKFDYYCGMQEISWRDSCLNKR